MGLRIQIICAVTCAVLICGTTSAQDAIQPTDQILLTGRIVDGQGTPIAAARLNLWNVTTNNDNRAASTSQSGGFVFYISNRNSYTLNLEMPGVRSADLTIHIAEVSDIDLGTVVMRLSKPLRPAVVVSGPLKVTNEPDLTSASAGKTELSAVYCSNAGGINFVHRDGVLVHQPKVRQPEVQQLEQEEQVGCSRALISDDRRVAGVLSLSNNCCTSYPIALKLLIYRPGRPLRAFTGDGRAIFQWRFINSGRQVAFYQDYLHGTAGQHYELRDIETGRLLGSWNGAFTKNAPRWTRGMRQ